MSNKFYQGLVVGSIVLLFLGTLLGFACVIVSKWRLLYKTIVLALLCVLFVLIIALMHSVA